MIDESEEVARITISLETFDDIFSDFDPRPYSQRTLSDDFLTETRRAALEKEMMIELYLLIPKKFHNVTTEQAISKRLRDHFHKHAERVAIQRFEDRRKGLWIACLGFALITSATFAYNDTTFLGRLLLIILEPSGWFTMWHGFDQYLDGKRETPEQQFYRKMSNVIVTFGVR